MARKKGSRIEEEARKEAGCDGRVTDCNQARSQASINKKIYAGMRKKGF